MAAFKKEILTRFVGTDEGDITEFLGCQLIGDRSAKTAEIVRNVCADRVLKSFGMRDCKSCATPLDANSRLSMVDLTSGCGPSPSSVLLYSCRTWST